MQDIRAICLNPEKFDNAMKRRGVSSISSKLLELDAQLRQTKTSRQDLLTERNRLSRQFSKADANHQEIQEQVSGLKREIGILEQRIETIHQKLHSELEMLPNTPDDDVPEGVDESSNLLIREWGARRPGQNREHSEIAESLNQCHFDLASTLSGARFVLLSDSLARLERALGNFMLDLHIEEHGYREILPPSLVKEEIVYGTGQLPKFRDDIFEISSSNMWLIPTAEVPLTSLVAGRVLDGAQLPLRVTAWTPCFRAEAGAAGRDTKGMIRLHQFSKVELVSITAPDQSEAELERMTECAEKVLKKLELPFRTMLLCAGDMGFAAAKTYDIEVWLPGQQCYREISSCSNCRDFQARRMNGRYRQAGARGTHFVHALNGSGLAVGRTIVALLENYCQPDGTVLIPKALQPYMGKNERIRFAKPL